MRRLFIDKLLFDENCLLGPSPRLLIWLHGCNRNCPGCIAVDWNSSSEARYSLSVSTLIQLIKSHNEIEGITISGGEPFLQSESLYSLVTNIGDKGVILYTGYTLEQLKKMNSEYINSVLESSDVLIDGEYIEELNDDKAFRGSSNQIIHHLTDRYVSFYSSECSRKTEFQRKDGFMYLYGIPTKSTRDEWNIKKAKEEIYYDSSIT